MKEYSVEENHKEELDKLWGDIKYRNISVVERGYDCVKTIVQESLLFIGINPSFDEARDSKVSFFYPSKNGHPFFKKLHEVADKTELEVAHLDLLFHRETEQKQIVNILGETNGLEFIWQQLQVSKNILELSKPKIIVVCNTRARQFLGFDKDKNQNVWLGYDFDFDEDLGTHKIISTDSQLNGKPVFFSSMLSGQRALDKGSLERLHWHIKFVLKKMNEKKNQ